jgi:hypothetical protein
VEDHVLTVEPQVIWQVATVPILECPLDGVSIQHFDVDSAHHSILSAVHL